MYLSARYDFDHCLTCRHNNLLKPGKMSLKFAVCYTFSSNQWKLGSTEVFNHAMDVCCSGKILETPTWTLANLVGCMIIQYARIPSNKRTLHNFIYIFIFYFSCKVTCLVITKPSITAQHCASRKIFSWLSLLCYESWICPN